MNAAEEHVLEHALAQVSSDRTTDLAERVLRELRARRSSPVYL